MYTVRQMMKVPNEPGLSPDNGLENAFLSDQSMASNPRKGQAERFGAKTEVGCMEATHLSSMACRVSATDRPDVGTGVGGR